MNDRVNLFQFRNCISLMTCFFLLASRQCHAESYWHYEWNMTALEMEFQDAVRREDPQAVFSVKEKLDLNTIFYYASAWNGSIYGDDGSPEATGKELEDRQEMMRRANCLQVEMNRFLGNEDANILWDDTQFVPLICRRVSQADVDKAKAIRSAMFNRFKDELEVAMKSGNQSEIDQKAALFKEAWPKIALQNIDIFYTMDRSYLEMQYQKKLKQDYIHLMFKAKARRCESPDEGFYKPANRCVPIGDDSACPEGFSLAEGDNDELFCDCATASHVYFVNQCVPLSSQGPCSDGQWVQLNDGGKPECQPIPAGCKLDQLAWKPDPNKPEVRCGFMWMEGPCPYNGILFYGYKTKVTCSLDPFYGTLGNGAPTRLSPCPSGSFRNQNNLCQPPA